MRILRIFPEFLPLDLSLNGPRIAPFYAFLLFFQIFFYYEFSSLQGLMSNRTQGQTEGQGQIEGQGHPQIDGQGHIHFQGQTKGTISGK